MKEKPAGPGDIRQMEEALAVTEAKLQAHYSQMGKSLLELADIEQRVVDGLVDEIIQLKKRLSQAKNEVQCPECMALSSADSHYCRHCGARLPATPNASPGAGPGKMSRDDDQNR